MSEDDPAKTRASPKDMNGPTLDPGTRQALERIRNALQRRQGNEAVRFFREASSHGLLPSDDSALTWLRGRLGNEVTEKLVGAFAVLPCFYCNKGVIKCEECGGRGYDAVQEPCVECLALGVGRCDFCGGSGWFTIHHVPHAFQYAVMIRRVVVAGKEADAIVAGDVPVVSDSAPRETHKLAARSLLQVNRLLGVLENMTVAADQLESGQMAETEAVRRVIRTCDSAASKLRERARRLIGILVESSNLEVGSASRKANRRFAERRAKFYAALASSENFAGTPLQHPLIFREEAAIEPKAAPSPAPDEE